MIVLDTNVVSEFMRPNPSEAVEKWALQQPAGNLGVTTVTVHEVEFGLARMPQGERCKSLQRSWGALLNTFGRWVMPLDETAAHVTARILARAASQGRSMGIPDAQIAGIALSTRSILATRNTKDFLTAEGLLLFNPFNAAP